MDDKILLVKLFDVDKELIGKGTLLSVNDEIIIVKGSDLPVINSKTKIYINVYGELTGIIPYYCEISVSTESQLTAHIIKKEPVIERRNALKVRTDLYFWVNKIFRNNEEITKDTKLVKIDILNLSIGGMLLSSNFEFKLDDEVLFYFKYYNYKTINLRAKIIRIDREIENDPNSKPISYGCIFLNMSNNYEAVIVKYLFERQFQLYKKK